MHPNPKTGIWCSSEGLNSYARELGRLPCSALNDFSWLSFVICFSRQTGRRQSSSPPCLGAACVWIWRWQVRVRQIRNSTVCIWCAIVHCSMRISVMRPQPMGYRHRWDHFSPRCPILKDLNQVMAWKMWVILDNSESESDIRHKLNQNVSFDFTRN